MKAMTFPPNGVFVRRIKSGSLKYALPLFTKTTTKNITCEKLSIQQQQQQQQFHGVNCSKVDTTRKMMLHQRRFNPSPRFLLNGILHDEKQENFQRLVNNQRSGKHRLYDRTIKLPNFLYDKWVKAISEGDTKVVKEMLSNFNQVQLLMCKIKVESLESKESNQIKESQVMPLHLAMQYGFYEIVEELLRVVDQNKLDEDFYNKKDEDDISLLHYGISGALQLNSNSSDINWFRCIQMLCQKPVHLDICSKDTGYSPLLVTSRFGLSSICLLLLQHGADINIVGNSYKESCLHLSAEYNHVECLQFLTAAAFASKNLQIFENKDINGTTFFDCANSETSSYINNKCAEHIQQSLKNRHELKEESDYVWFDRTHHMENQNIQYDWNKKDIFGNNILMAACFEGNIDIVRTMCKKSDDIISKLGDSNILGWTALHWATNYANPRLSYTKNRHEIIKYLIEHRHDLVTREAIDGVMPIMNSYHLPNETIELMVKKTLEMKEITSSIDGSTPVSYLIARHCSNDNQSGERALEIFKIFSSAQWFSHALGKRTNDGTSPLLMSCTKGALPVVKALIETYGIDANGAENIHAESGVNPLISALAQGHIHVAQYLLKKCGVDINYISSSGVYALLYAIHYGNTELVAELIDRYGANVDLFHPGSRIPPPLSLAVCSLNVKIVELLLKRGAKTDLRDGMGLVPLDYVQALKKQVSNPQQKQNLESILCLLNKK